MVRRRLRCVRISLRCWGLLQLLLYWLRCQQVLRNLRLVRSLLGYVNVLRDLLVHLRCLGRQGGILHH
jgi:hypothetical protein